MSSFLRSPKRFGSFVGVGNDDLRVTIGGTLQKNALVIVASYNPVPTAFSTPAAPFAGAIPAYSAARFWGRILAFEGIPDTIGISAAPIDLTSQLEATPSLLLDHSFDSMGPHTFFFPIAQLESNVQTSEGGILTVILCRGFTDVGTEHFIPRLTLAGQTVMHGGFV